MYVLDSQDATAGAIGAVCVAEALFQRIRLDVNLPFESGRVLALAQVGKWGLQASGKAQKNLRNHHVTTVYTLPIV
jgi:hypothetical protein